MACSLVFKRTQKKRKAKGKNSESIAVSARTASLDIASTSKENSNFVGVEEEDDKVDHPNLHSAVIKKSNEDQDHCADSDRLCTQDLKEVRQTVWAARDKWYDIGVELCMDPADLEAIRSKHHNDPRDCFTSMLTDYLKGYYPRPTWEALARALKQDTVAKGEIAEKIESKHLWTEYMFSSSGGIEQTSSLSDEGQSPKLFLGSDSDSNNSDQALVSPRVMSESQNNDSVPKKEKSPSITSQKSFQCSCRKCNLKIYMSNGCPKDNERCKQFPYLDTKFLSKSAREDLEAKLESEIDKMIESFSELTYLVKESLKRQGRTPVEVAERVLSVRKYVDNSKGGQTLLQAQSIDEVFCTLWQHNKMSFFNYELLESVIKMLGTDQDRTLLKQYLAELETFWKRSVFEVPPNVYHVHGCEIPEDSKPYAVKLEGDDISLGDVKKAQRRIAKLLDVQPSALLLCSVHKGCVKLEFSLPKEVYDEVLPLNSTQREELKKYGIKQCDTFNNVEETSDHEKLVMTGFSNPINTYYDMQLSMTDQEPADCIHSFNVDENSLEVKSETKQGLKFRRKRFLINTFLVLGVFSVILAVVTSVATTIAAPQSSTDPEITIEILAQNFTQGEDAMIDCSSHSGDITWFRDGIRLTNSSNIEVTEISLLIRNTTTNDSGVYQCYVQGLLRKNITIYVFNNQAPLIDKGMSNFTFQYEDPLNLNCEILSGDEPINFLWEITTGLEHSVVSGQNLFRTPQYYVSGVYTCTASNEYGNDTFAINVQVNDPPRPVIKPLNFAGSNIIVYQGANVTLLCDSSVVDTFRIVWRKDGNSLTNTGNRLDISNTLPVNSGMYACGVTITDIESDTVSLRVLSDSLVALSIYNVNSQDLILADSNNVVDIVCLLHLSQSHGSFHWTFTKNGLQSPVDHRTMIDSSGTRSTLTIPSVGESDEGVYTCTHDDVPGGAASVRLEVILGTHYSNVSQVQSFVVGEDATIECPAFLGDPPGRVSWVRYTDRVIFLNNNPRYVARNGLLTINNIQPGDAGVYGCSINRDVQGLIMMNITVNVMPARPDIPLIDKREPTISIWYQDPLNLTCNIVSGEEPIEYTWTIYTEVEINQVPRKNLYRDPGRYVGGEYRCLAVNRHGADSFTYFVKVIAPPKPSTYDLGIRPVLEGSDLILRYEELTTPVKIAELNFGWSKQQANGQFTPVVLGGRITKTQLDKYLHINQVQKSDGGVYRVNISNEFGASVQTVRVEVATVILSTSRTVLQQFDFEIPKGSELNCHDLKGQEEELKTALETELDVILESLEIQCTNSKTSGVLFLFVTSSVTTSPPSSFELTVGGAQLSVTYCDAECSTPKIDMNTGTSISNGVVIVAVIITTLVIVLVVIVISLIWRYNRRKSKSHDIENQHYPTNSILQFERTAAFQNIQATVDPPPPPRPRPDKLAVTTKPPPKTTNRLTPGTTPDTTKYERWERLTNEKNEQRKLSPAAKFQRSHSWPSLWIHTPLTQQSGEAASPDYSHSN